MHYNDCAQSADKHMESSPQGTLLLRAIEQQTIVQYIIERVAVLLVGEESSFEEVSLLIPCMHTARIVNNIFFNAHCYSIPVSCCI